MMSAQPFSWLSTRDASSHSSLNEYSHFCDFIFPSKLSFVMSSTSSTTPSSPTPSNASLLPHDESSHTVPAGGRARSNSQPSLMLAFDCITCNSGGAISLSSCMSCLKPPTYNTDHSLFRGRSKSDPCRPSLSRPTSKTDPYKERCMAEEAKAFASTKARVEKAAATVLDVSLDVVRESLYTGADLLSLAPVMGLQEVVKTLLMIWENCQQVERNKTSCLRLTQRCADILISIKAEIDSAGETVADELQEPINKLKDAFKRVQILLQRQAHRQPFLRYLKREEISREISGCDTSLHDALEMFSLAIQIRILKQIQSNEAKRQRDAACFFESLRTAAGHPEAHHETRPGTPMSGTTLYSLPESRSCHPPALSITPISTPPMTPEPNTPTGAYFQSMAPLCLSPEPLQSYMHRQFNDDSCDADYGDSETGDAIAY